MDRILEEILEKTKEDLPIRKKEIPFEVLKKSIKRKVSSSFLHAMKNPKKGKISIIAEIKFASPTEMTLGSSDLLVKRVKEYERAGADAISVVTEKHFFKGDPKFVLEIKRETTLPVLQKDFILDTYQLYEVVKNGADAILLIAKILSKEKLEIFVNLAKELGLEPIVEIDNQEDLEKTLAVQTNIIAVNARNLDTFVVDVDRACKLLQKVPKKFVRLGFSGVSGKGEVQKYKNAGAKGVLIGTNLMKAQHVIEFIEELRI